MWCLLKLKIKIKGRILREIIEYYRYNLKIDLSSQRVLYYTPKLFFLSNSRKFVGLLYKQNSY